jgi:prepilin-type N-terminal cleavage/methylation domain-containing protein
MTSAVGNKLTKRSKPREDSAFTLVELILVMALLVIVISIASPTLARFFRGRALSTEAGRLLALTRYGQSEAVSTGVPMVVWINWKEGTYGMREETGFQTSTRSKGSTEARNQFSTDLPRDYELAKDLSFELPSDERVTNNIATIRFIPDGSIDEDSLRSIYLKDKENTLLPLIQATNRLRYELSDQIYATTRSRR